MKTATVTYRFPEVSYDLGWEEADKEFEKNWATLIQQDKEARANRILVGRYIEEGIADGSAVYVITKENKTTVRINHVTGLGDDYMIPYWGHEASIKKNYVINKFHTKACFKRWMEERKK